MEVPPTRVMPITSPAQGDVLGLQFSVFGACDAITPTNNPAITVTLYNNGTPVGDPVAAVNNPAAGTWEAFFNLPASTMIQKTGSLEVACDGVRCASVGGLTIQAQVYVTIGEPTNGQSFQPGQANGVGFLVGGCTLHVFVTQAGAQLPGPFTVNEPLANDYTANLMSLQSGQNYVLHTRVLNPVGQDVVRTASGFFSVGGV